MPFIAIVYASTPAEAAAIRERYSQPDVGRLVGLYNFPATGQGPGCTGSCKAGTGWTRHPQSGHIMHACGKRNRDWREHVRRAFFDFFGRNRVKNPPAVFKNPEGW